MIVYQDDDYCPEEDEECRTLAMQVAANDYFLWTYDAKGGRCGPPVRIRTSGSSDPRNLRVCLALRELWEALQEPGS